MDTTRDETDSEWRVWPTYHELFEENRRLEARLRAAQDRIEKLERLVEELRRAGHRQAAPARRKDEPTSEPKKPCGKSGRRHGPHAHRGVPPRIDETYDVPLPAKCPH
ncbi:MAG: hypothetical protein HY288_01555 [Planctomycetia bacterium]|nr:hypothetical protein [Planctomycetia bacterium]